MPDAALTDADHAQAEQYDGLGPAYFAARRVCEGAMAAFEVEHMKPIVKKASDDLYEQLLQTVQDHIWGNAEMNLQGKMYQMVDECVQALLGGRDWAMKRYVLGQYDCDKIRAAVAAHVPKELQDKRIADLEAELKRVKSDLEWFRAR